MAEKKKNGPVNPFKDNSETIDEKAADEYMKYMHADNQAQLAEEHEYAASNAYVATKKFMEGLSLPERGKKLDDKVATDILVEYVTNLIERIHSPGFKEHFKKHKFKNEDERTFYLGQAAEQYLGIKANMISGLKNQIKKNKEIGGVLDNVLGKHMRDKKALEYLNDTLYSQAFDKIQHYKPGMLGNYLRKHKEYGKYEEIDNAFDRLTPKDAQTLVDAFAQGHELHEDHLERYNLKKREKKPE